MATTLNVRVNGPLEEFIAENIGARGLYENASEYVRDLIRKDKERSEQEAFEALKAELQRAYATSDEEYVEISADDVIARARTRWQADG